jgi:hypothetical protein
METPIQRADRERYEAWAARIPEDDEPVDDETRARLHEPRNPAEHVTLEEYLASRPELAS